MLDDAIDGLSARDAEKLLAKLQKRLQVCIIDGSDGAVPVRCTTKAFTGSTFTLLMCPACIEKHRLPETRSK